MHTVTAFLLTLSQLQGTAIVVRMAVFLQSPGLHSHYAKPCCDALLQFCLRKLKDGGEPGKQIGKISFIDLAGSERGAGQYTLLLPV